MSAPSDYYLNHQKAGLQASSLPPGVANPRVTIPLQREQDYLINPKVEKISMGLGWDRGVDVDASCALFDANGQVVDLVFFNNLKSKCKSVQHSGDDRTGEGGGDDEVIKVKTYKIPAHVHRLLFTVCIYSGAFDFSQVQRAYVRMMNGKPKYNGQVLCYFYLTEMRGYAMIVGMMTRKGALWNFKTLGHPAQGNTIVQMVGIPQNLHCLSMDQSFPPAYRSAEVRVSEGAELVALDSGGLFGKASSDPYFKINFRKREYISDHVPKTLNPKWKGGYLSLGKLTEAEPKALKVTIYDYDAVSSDDFMGAVWIPGSAIFNLGPGNHEFWFNLSASKHPELNKKPVRGKILISFKVSDNFY